MAEMRKRTSMSVLEMGRMLGLGKTESYWLIKKNYFKTILVGNTMRSTALKNGMPISSNTRRSMEPLPARN